MYKIQFDNQPRHDEPDTEGNSIVLSQKDYENLPPYHAPDLFNQKDKVILKGRFYEQVRNPCKSFPCISFSTNDTLGSEEKYFDDSVDLKFVCIDEEKDFWIAFYFCDLTTPEDAYGSTVRVAFPNHGTVYRIDEETKIAMHKYLDE